MVHPRTLAVVDRLGFLDAPPLGSLTIFQKGAAAEALYDAWVFGEIPGHPDSEHELILAHRHVLRMPEIEARRGREAWRESPPKRDLLLRALQGVPVEP